MMSYDRSEIPIRSNYAYVIIKNFIQNFQNFLVIIGEGEEFVLTEFKDFYENFKY